MIYLFSYYLFTYYYVLFNYLLSRGLLILFVYFAIIAKLGNLVEGSYFFKTWQVMKKTPKSRILKLP